jgi:hypothetical protein
MASGLEEVPEGTSISFAFAVAQTLARLAPPSACCDDDGDDQSFHRLLCTLPRELR